MTCISRLLLPSVLTCLLCYINPGSAIAQKNALKFGATVGVLPYLGDFSIGPELQYDRWLSPHIWLSFNANYYQIEYLQGYFLTPSLFSSSFVVGEINQQEKVFNTDLLCQTSIHYGWTYFKPAFGLSIVADGVNGPIEAMVKNNTTTPVKMYHQWETVPMLTTVGELEFKPGKRFVFGVKGALRYNPNKNKATRTLNFQTDLGNISVANTYMYGVVSASARIGFLF